MKKNNKRIDPSSQYGRYVVESNQNIFDIAVDIHGTVDGLTDILIHNQWLGIDAELKQGDEIVFTSEIVIDDDTVEDLDRMRVTPITGEREVYFKEPAEGAVMDMFIATSTSTFQVIKSGDSVIHVDWGDNSDIERIPADVNEVSHEFDVSDKVDIRRIRTYIKANEPISIEVKTPDIVQVLAYESFDVREYIDDSEITDIRFVRLFNGLKTLKLNNISTVDLTPASLIESLQDIEIKTQYTTPEAMDEFFISIVNNYGGRMPAKIQTKIKPNGEYKEPSGEIKNGMEAVWQLTNDPEWNTEFHKWQIIIDGVDYSQVTSVKSNKE